MADRYDHETLLAYIEGELSDEARARFEAQLAEDAELRRLVEGLAGDRDALRGLPREATPTVMVDDAMQQLERQMLLGSPSNEPIPIESSKGSPRRHRVYKTLAYSGIAAIMLLSGGLIVLTLTDTNAIETAQRIVQLGQADEAPAPGTAPGTAPETTPGITPEADVEPPIEPPVTPPGEVALEGETPAMDDGPMALAERASRRESDAVVSDGPTVGEVPERLTLSPTEPTLPDDGGSSLALRLRWPGQFDWDGTDRADRVLDTETPRENVEAMAMRQAGEAADDTESTLMEPMLPWTVDGTLAAQLQLNQKYGVGGDDWTLRVTDVEPTDTPVMTSRFESESSVPKRRADLSLGASPDQLSGRVQMAEADKVADPAEASTRMQVAVASADADRTQSELTAWVVSNRATLLPGKSDADATAAQRADSPQEGREAAPMRRMRAAPDEAADGLEMLEAPPEPFGERQQMRVRIDARQLPDLLAYLNRDAGQQRAELLFETAAPGEQMPASPIEWDALTGAATFRPPLQRTMADRAWMEVELIIVPLAEAEGEADD